MKKQMSYDECRAAAKRGDSILISFVRVVPHDQSHDCFVCGATHKTQAVARVELKQSVTHLPLCDGCFATGDRDHAFQRRFLNVLSDGQISAEQADVIIQQLNAAAH